MKKNLLFLVVWGLLLSCSQQSAAQAVINKSDSQSGWFSLGGRSTLSLFDGDGTGIGTGGQFRIQLSNQVNTDWFADYISINVQDKVRSDYAHIGWSVLFYPFNHREFPKVIQPYIVAGHCFDYNKKTALNDASNSAQRWGSAVQAGLGTHINITDRFDISLTCQYMIHLTKELDADIDGDEVTITEQKPTSLEGHLLTTVSFNYKLFKLWKR
ncbi:outer membrane beta-barrel protein [Flavobacterium aciduliphilum]|uniref:Outer membrane protein with beta-barrel domain n=1 Tax=Flavobacterium aciduliphilum TaxID=1101402 RepID=A0A328YS26_9FLAO|nr:outer membrane beta-barrel protein [Flavobacterium aciduliphilum]RAR75555.1 outer membrane protein with beta-barrel domain [Flavobacterium aciduliphilum]